MAEQDPLAGFAATVVREEGQWRCQEMDAEALGELDAAITELRKARSTGAVFGLLAVDDLFFVIVRPSPSGAALLLSDSGAAHEYDIAADVLDLLRAEPPDEEDEAIWPEGDLEILSDLGLPGDELEVIIGDVDLYPDEQLQMIAQRCGFADEFTALLDRI